MAVEANRLDGGLTPFQRFSFVVWLVGLTAFALADTILWAAFGWIDDKLGFGLIAIAQLALAGIAYWIGNGVLDRAREKLKQPVDFAG